MVKRSINTFFICFLIGAFFCTSIQAKKEVIYIPEKKLPRKVFLLPPLFVKSSNLPESFSTLLTNTLQNYLSGKGYIILSPLPSWAKGLTFSKWNPKEVASKLKGEQGFFVTIIHDFSGLNVVLFKKYKIDAELCLFNSQGQKMACWREKVSRRKLDLATDPLGLAAKLVGEALSNSSETKMKLLVYDWVYQVTALVPGFSIALRKPKILRVFTNIAKDKIFKEGDKILVIIEGDPGLKASFDLGTFRKGIRAIEMQQPGIYKGFYTVQKGDQAKGLYLLVHLKNQQGEEREWLELEPPINIDGVPPEKPEDLKFVIENNKVKLTWHYPDADVQEFIVFKSKTPLSGYKEVARVKDLTFLDTQVQPGEKVYYRLAARDKAGNLSPLVQIGPVEVPVSNKLLEGKLPPKLPPGTYKIKGKIKVPVGQTTEIGPNVCLYFSSNATLEMAGTLKVQNTVFLPQDKTWPGIKIGEQGIFRMINGKIVKPSTGLEIKGKAYLQDVLIYKGETGIKVGPLARLDLKDSKIYNFKKALALEGGEAYLERDIFKDNQIAIENRKGDLKARQCNFINNKVNIKSLVPLTVSDCYLGLEYTQFRLKGPIKIISYLSAPFPEGKEIKVDPKALKKQAQLDLKKGKEYIQKGDYGKACVFLEKAYKLSPDEEVYYWLIYVYSLLEEDQKLASLLNEALIRFPYEVRLYQLAVRYYLFKNKIEEAEKVVDKALKLQPKNAALESLKVLIQEQKKKGQK